MLIKSLLIVGFISISVFLASAQASTKSIINNWKSKLFEYGLNKYNLKVMKNGRHIIFENNSDLEISGFKLGCVKRMNGYIKKLSEQSLINETISPSKEKEKYKTALIWSSNNGQFPFKECKKGKLAIIEVYFENNTVWNLN